MKIKFEEISVIVRGLIVGAGETDEKKKFTKRALLSVRQHLPGAKIILSTWKGSDVDGLDYDELILNDPPVAPTLLKSDGTLKFMTGNNQIVAMRNGLEKSQQKYTLTMRSDMVLLGTRFIDYFLKFNLELVGNPAQTEIKAQMRPDREGSPQGVDLSTSRTSRQWAGSSVPDPKGLPPVSSSASVRAGSLWPSHMSSDSLLVVNETDAQLGAERGSQQALTKDSVVFEKRIVTLPTYNPRRKAVYSFLFNVSDWLYFGLTADIQKMLDIPLMSEDRLLGEKENGHYLYDENFETEQYIWSTFLKKYQPVPLPQPKFFSEEALVASEESYARNLILLPAQKAQVDCLKMPHAGYGARPILSQGLYTFNEYKKMYNRYSSKKVLYIPNPAENLLYWTLLKTRLLLKKISPEKYKKIVNSVRRLHRSDNLLK